MPCLQVMQDRCLGCKMQRYNSIPTATPSYELFGLLRSDDPFTQRIDSAMQTRPCLMHIFGMQFPLIKPKRHRYLLTLFFSGPMSIQNMFRCSSPHKETRRRRDPYPPDSFNDHQLRNLTSQRAHKMPMAKKGRAKKTIKPSKTPTTRDKITN